MIQNSVVVTETLKSIGSEIFGIKSFANQIGPKFQVLGSLLMRQLASKVRQSVTYSDSQSASRYTTILVIFSPIRSIKGQKVSERRVRRTYIRDERQCMDDEGREKKEIKAQEVEERS